LTNPFLHGPVQCMEAKFEVPSELAPEWARKRWAKPNARQHEAQQRVRRRLAARADGELALAVMLMHEVGQTASRLMGRQHLLDERPLKELGSARRVTKPGAAPVNSGAPKEIRKKRKKRTQ
jgi:hypothetical protein